MSRDDAKVERIRSDFPILERTLPGGRRLVYLDNAATTQKPRSVIRAMTEYYEQHNANVHRGVHQLAVEATQAYEDAHEKAARFVGGGSYREAVFTRNCTEALNLVAWGWGLRTLRPGDEVVTSQLEHHSNLVPWQEVTKHTGSALRYVTLTKDGEIDLESAKATITAKTKMVTISGASNTLGSLTPLKEITQIAHDRGALVLVDAAQLVPHARVDAARIGCDLLAFSGHKMLGPTGIGVLWGTEAALDRLYPFNFGGEMIRKVTFQGAEWNELPWRFEAGTPNVAEAVGLAAALDYLDGVGMDWVHDHGRALVAYAMQRLAEEGCDTYGPGPDHRSSLVSFNVPGVHPHDLASLLDERGVAIRAGHHCTMPLHDLLGLAASARASFYVYNTRAEVDALIEGVRYARGVLGA